MKERKNLFLILAVAGNILFMLWMSYNAVADRFAGTFYEKLSYIGLIVLLVINTLLLLSRKNKDM